MPGGAEMSVGGSATLSRRERRSAQRPHVRPFLPEDEAPVLELLQASFGCWPPAGIELDAAEFLRWKHFECPFGRSLLLVAEVDGQIAGFQGRVSWRLRAGARAIETMRGADLAVHPRFRRRGVSQAIRRAAVFPPQIEFTWSNPNPQSEHGSRKFGRRAVPAQPHFLRPHRPLLLCPPWRRRTSRSPDAPPRIDAPLARSVLLDGAFASGLLDAHAPDPRLHTARSLDYLRWRYGRFGEYRALRADGALAIFRVRRHRSLWLADVTELLVADGDARSMREVLHGVRETCDVDATCCSFASHSLAARGGFVRCPQDGVLMVTPLRDDLAPDPTKPGSWVLSRGDLELI
jgi:GNAT superfamily N-acetyltransferase